MWQILKHQFSTLRGAANQLFIQVAAVFGAVGILALFGEVYSAIFLFEFEFKGFLEPLVNFWREVFRPAAAFFLRPIEALLSLVFGFEFRIPSIIIDYIAVGITFLFARWRASVGGWKGGLTKAKGWLQRKTGTIAWLAVKTVFVWPAELVHMTRNLLFARKRFPERSNEDIAQIRYSHLLGLSPAFIAIILSISNWIYVIFFEIPMKLSSDPTIVTLSV